MAHFSSICRMRKEQIVDENMRIVTCAHHSHDTVRALLSKTCLFPLIVSTRILYEYIYTTTPVTATILLMISQAYYSLFAYTRRAAVYAVPSLRFMVCGTSHFTNFTPKLLRRNTPASF